MRISVAGINLIKEREGFRSHPYLDGGGVPTIGFGSTRYPDGRHVTMRDKPITRSQADELFVHTLGEYETTVNNCVRKPVTQPQFDALVSLCYNIGCGAFRLSTLVRMLNSGFSTKACADQFLRWNKDNGKVVAGLTERREIEMKLFLS